MTHTAPISREELLAERQKRGLAPYAKEVRYKLPERVPAKFFHRRSPQQKPSDPSKSRAPQARPGWVTTARAAEMAGVSNKSMRDWIGGIEGAEKVGYHWEVPLDAVKLWLRNREHRMALKVQQAQS